MIDRIPIMLGQEGVVSPTIIEVIVIQILIIRDRVVVATQDLIVVDHNFSRSQNSKMTIEPKIFINIRD